MGRALNQPLDPSGPAAGRERTWQPAAGAMATIEGGGRKRTGLRPLTTPHFPLGRVWDGHIVLVGLAPYGPNRTSRAKRTIEGMEKGLALAVPYPPWSAPTW